MRRARKGTQFTKEQPRDGDSVALCLHFEKTRGKKRHFWKLPDSILMIRPDESKFRPQWIVSCDRCYREHKSDPYEIPIGNDARWKGDDPAIEHNQEHYS